ncbi:DNA modification methylase [Xanthobacter aminoxidans]|uniref:DNA modification methylase n=1 Tax=Xanthobacter aminoxidans TaxID=186280 RepID=UPI003727FA24
MSTPNSLVTEIRRIADLKPYANSPRVHSRDQRQKATSILRRFGQVTPIIIDPDGTIIDGHLVAETLAALGHDEVVVVVQRNRNPGELRALRLALNRLAEDATWDKPKLRAEFEALLEISFDLSLTGFDQVEIDMSVSIDEPNSGIVEDAPLASDLDGPVVSRLGDRWRLRDPAGKTEHLVICGDARDPQVHAALMVADSARMMFTDPTYNVKIDGHVSGHGRGAYPEFEMASGEMTSSDFTAFLTALLTTSLPGLAEGAVLFVCMDWRHLPELFAAVEAARLTLLNLCVWDKTNAGMGSFYRSQHEMILAVKKGTAPHVTTFELGKKGRSRSNVWTYRGMNVLGAERDDLLKVRPTVKPVTLVADAIKDVSHRGDIVLDPVLGSGTTLIAAHEAGRRCFGIEYDPANVDFIVRRWLHHTGGSAVLTGTEETFGAREAKVLAASRASDSHPRED